MKRKIYIIYAFLGMTFTGCDNILDSTPAVTISEDLFWQTEDDAEKAIIGVYGPLMDEYYFAGHTEPVWDVQSDDLYRAGDWGDDAQLETFNANPEQGELFGRGWKLKFEGIKRANDVLRNVPSMSISEQKKNEILGQAYFMRAFHYSRLMLIHGRLPLYDENLPISEYNKPRATHAETYEFIERDLEKAAELLPLSWPEADLGKPTKASAWGLLCRFYLYEEKYQEVVNTANKIFEHKDLYSLMDNYGDNFLVEKRNEKEVLFAVKMMMMADSPAWPFNLYFYPHAFGGWNFFHPEQSLVDEFEYLDGSPRRKIKFQKEDAENCKYVFTDNGEIVNWQKEFIQRDPRLRATVVTCGESFNMDGAVYTFPAGDTMTGYCCNKYIDLNHHAGLCNLHYCIVRMSDIYLMKAEALLKQQGSSNAEIDGLINEVRRRVGLADISNCTMEDIIHERRCEFATEGLRHYDLIRWKLAKTVYANDNGPDGPRTFVEGKHELLPIPQSEIDLSQGVLVQNPGY